MSKNYVINNTKESRDNYYKKNKLWGIDIISLTEYQVKSLLDGKCIASNNGEYATFIVTNGE